MDISQIQKMHFDSLKVKYKIGQGRSAVSDNFLYLILRKADLGIQVTDVEFQWLEENRLSNCIEFIYLQQYKAEEKKRLEAEFMQLRAKYRIPDAVELPVTSPVYSVLWKLETECALLTSDIELLNAYGLVDTVALMQDILNFSELKNKYKVTQDLNRFPSEPIFRILKKLDAKEELCEFEAEWLLEQGFEETLEISWQQENIRKAEIEFSELKSKYQVAFYPETDISSKLYAILKQLEKS